MHQSKGNALCEKYFDMIKEKKLNGWSCCKIRNYLLKNTDDFNLCLRHFSRCMKDMFPEKYPPPVTQHTVHISFFDYPITQEELERIEFLLREDGIIH